MTSWPMPPARVAIATIVIGARPRLGARGMNITEMAITATLNIAGDSAGTKKCPSEFSMPISAAASAAMVRKGSMMRVRCTVNSTWPGTLLNSGAKVRTNGSAKTMPAITRTPVTRINALMTELPRVQARSRPCSVSCLVNVGTNAALIAPSAKRSRTRLGMRPATRNASAVVPAPK